MYLRNKNMINKLQEFTSEKEQKKKKQKGGGGAPEDYLRA